MELKLEAISFSFIQLCEVPRPKNVVIVNEFVMIKCFAELNFNLNKM